MILADWIALGLVAAFLVLGAVVGFGKGLRFFTKGIFGVIISFVVCYFTFGIVLSWGFVQDLLAKINLSILGSGENGFLIWLVETANIGKVIIAIIMFLVVQLARILIVYILKSVFEIKNAFFKLINRVFGAILFAAFMFMIALIIAHIIDWVGGDTEVQLLNGLSGSALKLDYLFEHNPLSYIIK